MPGGSARGLRAPRWQAHHHRPGASQCAQDALQAHPGRQQPARPPALTAACLEPLPGGGLQGGDGLPTLLSGRLHHAGWLPRALPEGAEPPLPRDSPAVAAAPERKTSVWTGGSRSWPPCRPSSSLGSARKSLRSGAVRLSTASAEQQGPHQPGSKGVTGHSIHIFRISHKILQCSGSCLVWISCSRLIAEGGRGFGLSVCICWVGEK